MTDSEEDSEKGDDPNPWAQGLWSNNMMNTPAIQGGKKNSNAPSADSSLVVT
jgi:hypothetical protein